MRDVMRLMTDAARECPDAMLLPAWSEMPEETAEQQLLVMADVVEAAQGVCELQARVEQIRELAKR